MELGQLLESFYMMSPPVIDIRSRVPILLESASPAGRNLAPVVIIPPARTCDRAVHIADMQGNVGHLS